MGSPFNPDLVTESFLEAFVGVVLFGIPQEVFGGIIHGASVEAGIQSPA